MTVHGAADTFVTVSIGDAIRFIWRGLPLAIGLGIVAAAAMWLVSSARPVQYTAAAYLLSTRHTDGYAGFSTLTPASLDPALYRAAVADGPVLQAALARMDGISLTRQELLRNLSIQSDNQVQSSIVTVAYTDTDPARASTFANLLADELIRWDLQRTARPLADWTAQLEADIEQLDAQISALPAGSPERTGLEAARAEVLGALAGLDSVLPLGQLSLVSHSEAPAEPDSRRRITSVALAIVVAVLAAYALRLLIAGRGRNRQ